MTSGLGYPRRKVQDPYAKSEHGGPTCDKERLERSRSKNRSTRGGLGIAGPTVPLESLDVPQSFDAIHFLYSRGDPFHRCRVIGAPRSDTTTLAALADGCHVVA